MSVFVLIIMGGETGATSMTLVPPMISLMSKNNVKAVSLHNHYIVNWTLEVGRKVNWKYFYTHPW